MIAVRMAPPAPPAANGEMMLQILKWPDSAAAITEGSARVTIWPSTPPPTRPETMFPTVPRSKLGDALPTPAPPIEPAMRLIKICSIVDLRLSWQTLRYHQSRALDIRV